jgi:hypothetical protein
MTDKTDFCTLNNPRSNDKQHITIERSGITMIYDVRTTQQSPFFHFLPFPSSSHIAVQYIN